MAQPWFKFKLLFIEILYSYGCSSRGCGIILIIRYIDYVRHIPRLFSCFFGLSEALAKRDRWAPASFRVRSRCPNLQHFEAFGCGEWGILLSNYPKVTAHCRLVQQESSMVVVGLEQSFFPHLVPRSVSTIGCAGNWSKAQCPRRFRGCHCMVWEILPNPTLAQKGMILISVG